jgi:DNA polymerase III subunit alpha
MSKFVSLHNQTDYSILDSTISTKMLFKRAEALGQPAVAITDHGSIAAAWEAWKVSKDTPVKLIIGCECYFHEDNAPIDQRFRHIILLAKNAIGYKNLLTLNKKGFDNNPIEGKKPYSVLNWKMLEEHSEGLICLTSCGYGIVSRLIMDKRFNEAEEALLKLKSIFGENLGVEIQTNNMKRGFNVDEIDQHFLNRKLIELGKKNNIRIVPTCNAHYLTKEDHEVHDTMLAIGAKQSKFSNFRLKYPTPEFYLKSEEEVKTFFSRNYGEDFANEICENTLYFANLCEKPEWIDPKFSNPSGKELPSFPVKDAHDYKDFLEWKNLLPNAPLIEEDNLYLRYKCFKRLEELKPTIPEDKFTIYLDRMNEEIETLEFRGFSSYMLIVADYVQWGIKNNIPMGPGRGSCGGCLVAYLLDIHHADSIKYGLIFERFQNKQKLAFPDIDQDISKAKRDLVLEYLKNKYGSDHMCAISNYNTITPKVYARDIARALELGGSREESVKIGTSLADLISNDIGKLTKIDEVFNKAPLLAEHCKKYPGIKENGILLGKPRARSQHAAGIIISQRSLVGLAPLRKEKGTWLIEYDKDLSEENGFVKMDLLGLETLDIIDAIVTEIKKSGKPFNNEHLNYDDNDQKTYDLITAGDTFCVFQLGTSAGTIDLCRKVKPKNIEDLAIITTLARPAAANIRNDFIMTREGKKEVTLLHPSLNGAFQKTYGFGLFDESILQLGKDVAGWSLNDADRIRKMIKEKGKNPEKDKKLRDEFIAGAIQNGIEPIIAPRIWDEEVGKFASYTFNKAHAVTYSMLSYQTAYLKAHFPVEFLLINLMAEVKSNSPDAKNNIAKIKKELRAHKIKILPPNLNHSNLSYSITDNKLLTGLDALKFVGDDAIVDIIEKRPFNSFFDFMVRVSSKKVRANNIQALAAAGAMDSFRIPRKLIYQYCSDYRKKLQVWLKKNDPNVDEFFYPWPKESDWSMAELYALEQYYLGEAFVCKPADAYKNFFKTNHHTIYEVKKAKEKQTLDKFRCIVRDSFIFKVKKETSKFFGQAMAKVDVEDKNGDHCSLTIFPDRLERMFKRIKQINSKAEFENGLAMEMSVNTNIYEDESGVILNDLFDISMIPSLPSDMKIKKKLNLKEEKAKITGKNNNPDSLDDANNDKTLEEEIEDEMIEEGFLDEENDEDSDF